MNQNDVREAIEYLKHIAEHPVMTGKYCEALKIAISALEKQLASEPENKVHEDYKVLGKNYYCKCGVMFYNWENQPTNFCGNCGQKLKGG